MATTTLESELIETVRSLPPEKQQEVLGFARFLDAKARRPFKNIYGTWKDVDIDISEEDIAEARKEMSANFPHCGPEHTQRERGFRRPDRTQSRSGGSIS